MQLFKSITYLNDLKTTVDHSVGIEQLKDKSVLITGCTGTIGSFVTDTLLYYNNNFNANITIYAAGRNITRLEERFSEYGKNNIHFLQYDMNNFEDVLNYDIHPDFIIHAAGNAHPAAFNGDPVGTLTGNVMSTFKLLEFASTHGTKRLLYVSSGEVYGQGDLSLEEFEESYAGYIDTASPRSCYPISKRAAENLCVSYAKQYGLETVIVRPCHTYGPGITPSDSRANALFFRNALDNKDIVLTSAGTQMRSYNYIADCASALITVLMKGNSGEAYNTANPNSRITIAEFAKITAESVGKQRIFANPSEADIANRTPIAKQVLSSKKIEALGWTGAFTAQEGIIHTIRVLKGE